MFRKETRRKSTVMALTAMLAMSVVLAACSGGNKTNNGGSSPSASTASPSSSPSGTNSSTPAPSALPETTLTLYIPGTAPKDETQIEDKVNEYLKDKINAKIDLRIIDWGNYDNTVRLNISSREVMDIIFTASWNGHVANVANGGFLALNDPSGPYGDLLKDYGQGIVDALPPIVLANSQIKGKNYGMPTYKEMAEEGGIIYRTDVAEELGLTAQLDAVKTIADLEPILQTVKDKKPDWTPLFLRKGENFNAHYFGKYDYFGDSEVEGMLFKDGTDTKVVMSVESDKYKEIATLTHNLFKKNLVNADAPTSELSPTDALKTGKVFMTVSPLKPGKAAEMETSSGLTGKLKQVTMTSKTISSGETTGAMLGISTTSKDPARAMMFISLLYTDSYLNNLLNFGIEGTHFTKNGDIISRTDKTGDYLAGAAAWMLGSQFLNYVWDNEAADKWEQFKAFNDGAKAAPALGFLFDSEPVKTQVAVIKNVYKEFAPAIETGAVDPAQIDEYVKRLKDNGIDAVITEKQKQLDEYLASK